MRRQIYLNLPVADLDRSKAFFTALGFSLNPQFSDETGACVVVSEEIYLMILTHEKFGGFAPGPIAGPDVTEAIVCLSCESRAEVDGFMEKAVAAGGRPHGDVTDLDFMYGRGFVDLDGHSWELVSMNAEAMAAQGSAA